MSTHNESNGWTPVLEQIIDNAAGLSLDSQEWILRLAKGMEFTRKEMERKYAHS